MQRDPQRTSRVFEQAPRPELRPFVHRFLVVEFAAAEQDLHLPDTRAVAAFSFRGRCRLDQGSWVPRAAFTGLRRTARAHEHAEGHAVLLATFTPAGAAAFLPTPLEAFTGATVDLREALGPAHELDRLEDWIARAPNHSRRVLALEEFLLGRLRDPEPDPLVHAAVAWLEGAGFRRSVADLTRHIGLSQSALERRFRRVVGVTPKRFASMVRLKRAVALKEGGVDSIGVAQEAGYFDQAHFIHDFREATGTTPEAFFRPAATG